MPHTEHLASDDRHRTLGNSGLRLHNMSAILRTIDLASEPATRASLARETGLTKTAIGNLVGELIGVGVVTEGSTRANGVGRPSTELGLALDQYGVVTVDLGATFASVTLATLGGEVISHETDPARVGDGIPRQFEALAERVRQMSDDAADRGLHLVSCVVAAHSVTDASAGTLQAASGTVEMAKELRHALGRDLVVMVENDANLAALAEWRRWRSSGVGSLVSLSGELSIGAGVIVNRELHRGASGHAGMASHMVIDPQGPECHCGRGGCWSALVGLRPLLRRALPDLATALEPIPGYAALGLNAIASAAAAGEQDVIAAVKETGHWLGLGAANIANLLDPDLLLVGGYFTALDTWMLPAAREAFETRRILRAPEQHLLATSDLDQAAYRRGIPDLERARVVGGSIHLAIEQLLAHPIDHAR